MITNKDVEKVTGLTRQGVVYRLKQMEEAGCGVPVRYAPGKVGPIRVYTEEDVENIVNWKPRKPGRKRKDG